MGQSNINNVWTIKRSFANLFDEGHQDYTPYVYGVLLYRDNTCVMQLWFTTEARQIQVFESLSTNMQLYILDIEASGTIQLGGTH